MDGTRLSQLRSGIQDSLCRPQACRPGMRAGDCAGHCSSNFPQATIAEMGSASYCHHAHNIQNGIVNLKSIAMQLWTACLRRLPPS